MASSPLRAPRHARSRPDPQRATADHSPDRDLAGRNAVDLNSGHPAPPEPAALDPVRLDPDRLEPDRLDPVRLDPVRLDPVRLDTELVRRGLARSRDDATELVHAGAVSVAGQVAAKPALRVTAETPLAVVRGTPAYVSRGADKLAGALADFGPRGLEVRARRCVDVGASTGGFTEVLLAADATTVVAVDIGSGQLAPALRTDPRVQVRDGINARELTVDLVGEADVIVVDLSFISLCLVMPALARCLAPDGDILAMVKPQFEVGRARLDSRGVVRGSAQRLVAVSRVTAAALENGLGTKAATASRRPGPAGNVEYFLWLRRDAPPADRAMLRAAIAAGPT